MRQSWMSNFRKRLAVPKTEKSREIPWMSNFRKRLAVPKTKENAVKQPQKQQNYPRGRSSQRSLVRPQKQQNYPRGRSSGPTQNLHNFEIAIAFWECYNYKEEGTLWT